MLKQHIEFNNDTITLRGWFYSPVRDKSGKTSFPAIIMTHGFSALKEHSLSQFAEYFAAKGFYVLVYDNRNFGDSDGVPRLEVDPLAQISDLQAAITFLQNKLELDEQNLVENKLKLDEQNLLENNKELDEQNLLENQKKKGLLNKNTINKPQIALWGTSFSAGIVLAVAAIDKRISCAVVQVPFVQGHHFSLKKHKPEIWQALQKKYEMDRVGREQGKNPVMISVVTADPEKSAVMKQPSAYEFFTKIPQWENQVTLKSIQNSGDFNPLANLQQITSTPILFIVADADTVCPTELALQAYEKISTPKKLVMLHGEHFVPYQQEFAIAAEESCRWFKQWMIF